MKKGVQAIVIMLLLMSALIAAEQQNAAELYKKAFELCGRPNIQTRDMLKFKIGQKNQRVSSYVEANRQVIDLVVQAGQMENCDWKMSQSELSQTQYTSQMKDVVSLVIADGRLLSEKGDYDAALERASAVRTMAERLGGGSAVMYMVRIAADSKANEFIQDVLANIPSDEERLSKLRKQLEDAQDRQPAFEDILRAEEQNIALSTMPGGEKHSESAIQYWKDTLASIRRATKLPYTAAQEKLEKLKTQAEKDARKNPDALIAAGLVEPQMRMHSLCVRHQTHLNVTRAAVEVYIVKTDTGSLPEKLPEGLPKDMFSGEDFDYQRTDGGFTLRCKGKEAGAEDLYEFEFKITDVAANMPETEAVEAAQVEDEANEFAENGGEKAKGPVLDDVLAMWQAGEQDKAVEEFLKMDWEGERILADDSVLDVNESDYEAMSVEKKKQVRQQTVELMRAVRELTRKALEIGGKALSAKEFEKAETYFVAVNRCTKVLSSESAMAARKTVAVGVRRAALMRLSMLYDTMGEEVKLGEIREALRRL